MKNIFTVFLALAAVFALGVSAQGADTRVVGTSHVQWNSLTANDVVPGQLIVGYRDGAVATRAVASPSEQAWTPPAHMVRTREAAGVRFSSLFRRIPAEVVEVPGAVGIDDLRAAAEALAADPAVAFVEPNFIYHATAVPDDPSYDMLWGMKSIGAEDAWDISTGSRNIVVAVIDTGVRATHQDLAPNIWTNPGEIPGNGIDDDHNGYIDDVHGWDFVDSDNDPDDLNSHGTHCAGTIGAVGNDGIGIPGVNWQVSILPLRGLDARGSGSNADLAKAIEYAAWFDGKDGRPRVHLSSNSWGGPGRSEVIRSALDKAEAAGQLVIAAAGNETSDNDANFDCPASYGHGNIISVASLDKGDNVEKISSFSNYGKTSVDLGAPGGDIYSCGIVSDFSYEIKSGTSMATPHVSGAAALLWSIAPDVDYSVIRDAILNSAVNNPIPTLNGKCVTGGKLFLPDAIAYLGSLLVSPVYDQKWVGPAGGPFTPDSTVFDLLNPSQDIVPVTISVSETWVDFDVWSLDVDPGATASVTATPSADALALPEGTYEAIVTFSYVDSSGEPDAIERIIRLKVCDNYVLQSIVDPAWIDSSADASIFSGPSLPDEIPVEFSVPFRYYDIDYSNLVVFAGGAIAFGDAALPLPSSNLEIPCDADEDALVCPWWDTLVGVSSSQIAVSTNETGSIIVSWEDFAFAADPDARVSFQAVLTPADGANGTISFYIRDAAQESESGSGLSATSGIQDDGAFQACTYAVNGENPDYGTFWLSDDQGILFTWKNRLPDNAAPFVESVERLFLLPGDDEVPGKAIIDVRFSEIVLGLSASDFLFDGSTVQGTPQVTAIDGGGERFRVTIEGFTGYGRLNFAIASGAVEDLSGNQNATSNPFKIAMPYREVLFFDDFESGTNGWTTSTNEYSQATADIWELGTPTADYPADCHGPVSAASGSACWGTVLDGPYPKLANAFLQAPRVFLGENPIVEFQVAADLGFGEVTPFFSTGDYLVLEVSADGGAWEVVASIDLVSDIICGTAIVPARSDGAWNAFACELPAAYVGRAVDMRLRFVSDQYLETEINVGEDSVVYPDGAGIYIDDFRVSSLRFDGVWLVSAIPSELSPAAIAELDATIYCAAADDLADVTGFFGIADSAITIVSGASQSYGDLQPGDLVSNVVVGVELAGAGRFTASTIPLRHDAWTGDDYINGNEVSLSILGIDPTAADTPLEAFTSTGVADWLGRLLAGDGSDAASIIQIIWAGADGAINPPDESGAPTGDDQVLYATPSGQPFLRIGAGNGVQSDLGLFDGTVLHGLAAGAAIYARAWAGSSFATAVAYGDSALRAIAGVADEAIDFGSWTVGTPVHYGRDSNGDAIPDGWCVLSGLDPFEEIEPVAPSMEVAATASGRNSDAFHDNDLVTPRRAIVAGGFVVVASRKSATIPGAVQVYSMDLQNRVGAVDSVTAANGRSYSFDPAALAWDEADGILAVADTDRILFFGFDPATGALSYRSALPEYGTSGVPTATGRFKDIRDIAFSPSAGAFYVIDSKLVKYGVNSYYRVQSVATDLSTAAVAATFKNSESIFPQPPSAIEFILDGTFCLVANPGYGSIELLYVNPDGTLQWNDFVYIPDFPLRWPAGISCDDTGVLLVAERDAHRLRYIDLYTGNYTFVPLNITESGSFGSEDGRFHSPEGVFLATGDLAETYTALVADTGNNRVQWLNLSVDTDGDGMDDFWEIRNGLNIGVDDSMDDPDGDGLPNIGEQRAGTDPNAPDTNGNGGGDLWDMLNRIDPVGPSNPVNPLSVVSVEAAPAGVVFEDGSNVVVTVTFSAEVDPSATVTLALFGGAVAGPAAMTRVNATTYTFGYTVDGDDNGWVSATVSGARDTAGVASDPPSYLAADVFQVELILPPAVVSIVADTDPASTGSNVTFTVTFDKDVDSASVVSLALSGGATATVDLVQDASDATVFTGGYTVQASDLGAVTGVVSGASYRGAVMDPSDPEYLFTVEAAATPPGPFPEFAITAIGVDPFFLEWEAEEGGTYAAKSSDTLDSAGFTNVVFEGFVSPATGIVGWTNDTYQVTSPEFFRVYRTEPVQ